MIKLFDKNFDIKNLKQIYGLVNVREDKYSYGLTHFLVSNVFQIKKLLTGKNKNIYIAVSVNPLKNGQKNGKIKEIVQLINYQQNDIVKSKDITGTTGYCEAICKPILSFEGVSQNRLFFDIRPHGQYLIKQLFPFQSENIITYINKILGA